MGIRDNFIQAWKELFGRTSAKSASASSEPKLEPITQKETVSDKELTGVRLGNLYATEQTVSEPVRQAVKDAVREAVKEVNATDSKVSPLDDSRDLFRDVPRDMIRDTKMPLGGIPSMHSTALPGNEVTIISKNTIVEGGIRSYANINVEGNIKGNVRTTKNASISGKVVGNLECSNANMVGAAIQGDLVSNGAVGMDQNSLLLGDLSALNLRINGKIKGNLHVDGKAELDADSIILGDINATKIVVDEGAKIRGFVTVASTHEIDSSLFPEQVAITEVE